MCKELVAPLNLQAQHIDSLAQQMRVLIAINQRLLTVMDNAAGMPEGEPYIIDQPNPTTGAIYYGAVIPQASILRALCLSTAQSGGIVTVYIKSAYALGDPRVAGTPTGVRVIWRGATTSQFPVSLSWRVRLPAGSQLGIATAGTAETNLNLSAIVDQVTATASEDFYGRR